MMYVTPLGRDESESYSINKNAVPQIFDCMSD
jgi:hypothetical protein